ncbi:MAG: membrane integrity-associated transporter subunit PqiC [Verrucomicrobiae bacterium]|nr:membrane integrity-associated transporter subunit PqiC [Verrucomicrobiae bacterium]
MKHRQPSRRAFVGATLLLPWAVGCRLQRPPLAPRTFVLDPPAPAASVVQTGSGVLLVRPFRVAPAFEARPFVIRLADNEYATDAYHLFLLPPTTLLTEAWARWFRETGRFDHVTTGGSQASVTHVLEGEITELYGDYRDPAQPRARIAMELRIFHPWQGPASPVQWRHRASQSVPLPRAGADELVAGWNEALAAVAHAVAADWPAD